MSIWFRKYTLAQLNELAKNTMVDYLGIEFSEIGENYLKASMPVDDRTVQPLRLLHGGASAALSESLGSIAGNLCVNPDRQYCVGLEINANHIRPVPEGGRVTAVVRPIHIGKRTQVWETRISNERKKLVCVSRLTLAVMDKQTAADAAPAD